MKWSNDELRHRDRSLNTRCPLASDPLRSALVGVAAHTRPDALMSPIQAGRGGAGGGAGCARAVPRCTPERSGWPATPSPSAVRKGQQPIEVGRRADRSGSDQSRIPAARDRQIRRQWRHHDAADEHRRRRETEKDGTHCRLRDLDAGVTDATSVTLDTPEQRSTRRVNPMLTPRMRQPTVDACAHPSASTP